MYVFGPIAIGRNTAFNLCTVPCSGISSLGALKTWRWADTCCQREQSSFQIFGPSIRIRGTGRTRMHSSLSDFWTRRVPSYCLSPTNWYLFPSVSSWFHLLAPLTFALFWIIIFFLCTKYERNVRQFAYLDFSFAWFWGCLCVININIQLFV